MKKIIALIITFYTLNSFGQTVYSKYHMPATLKDTITGNFYILDSSHTCITAYNSCGNIIWTTRPNLNFPGVPQNHRKEAIQMVGFYNEPRVINGKEVKDKEMWYGIYLCGGYVNLRTGESGMIGCD